MIVKPFVYQVVADFDRTLSKYAHEGQVCSTTHGKGKVILVFA